MDFWLNLSPEVEKYVNRTYKLETDMLVLEMSLERSDGQNENIRLKMPNESSNKYLLITVGIIKSSII